MKLKQVFGFLFLTMVASSCSEDSETTTTSPGYDYFPLETGMYTTYEVDSIFHDQPLAGVPGIHDTAHYFLKEVVDSTFLDAEGETGYRIVRYKRDSTNQEWILTDIWSAKLSPNNAERIEENLRYVKLAFPISRFSNWDGNALNNLDEWRFSYDSLYIPRQYGDLNFQETVTVDERFFLTEVNDEFAYEVYAKDVGLIFRHHKVLFTRPSYLNNRVAQNIISGYEYKWEVIAYGME